MNGYSSGRMSAMPPVVKNLLIINVAMFVLAYFVPLPNFNMAEKLSIYYFKSPNFRPYQIVTHMFMHANFAHIFFNMFGLWMFGRVIESVWGSKRFFVLYFVAGIGAVALNEFVMWLQFNPVFQFAAEFINNPTVNSFAGFISHHGKYSGVEVNQFIQAWQNDPSNQAYVTEAVNYIREITVGINSSSMLGASGAIFGVLAAFALLFPNVELMLIFLPIPIKAKYFVPIYAVLELFLGVANFSGDNIAHFAHLGGAIFGFFIALYWKKNQFKIY